MLTVEIDFSETSLRAPIDSERGSYLKKVQRQKINYASVLTCLIGNATAWSDWVDWEIRAARVLHKGVRGVRLKGSHGRSPAALAEIGARVARWDMQEIIESIECAKAPVEKKLFRKVRISDPGQDQHVLDTLELLSKEQMRVPVISQIWNRHFVDGKVKAAVDDLFGNKDKRLLGLLRKKTSSLLPADIRSSLQRAIINADFLIITSCVSILHGS